MSDTFDLKIITWWDSLNSEISLRLPVARLGLLPLSFRVVAKGQSIKYVSSTINIFDSLPNVHIIMSLLL